MGSRELKFRGINLDTGKWVIGYGCIHSEKYGSQVIHEQGMNVAQHTQVIPETLGEFTGLKDKNGVEIYEGDIVKVKGRKRTGTYSTVVEYAEQGFKLKENKTYLLDNKSFVAIIEVIGNIYETPELL